MTINKTDNTGSTLVNQKNELYPISESNTDDNLMTKKDLSDYFEDQGYTKDNAELSAQYIIQHLSESSEGISMEQYQLAMQDDNSIEKIMIKSLLADQNGHINLNNFSLLFGESITEDIWQSYHLNPDEPLNTAILDELIDNGTISVGESGEPMFSIETY